MSVLDWFNPLTKEWETLSSENTGGGTAAETTYDPTTSKLVATNVQAAIDEIVPTKRVITVVDEGNGASPYNGWKYLVRPPVSSMTPSDDRWINDYGVTFTEWMFNWGITDAVAGDRVLLWSGINSFTLTSAGEFNGTEWVEVDYAAISLERLPYALTIDRNSPDETLIIAEGNPLIVVYIDPTGGLGVKKVSWEIVNNAVIMFIALDTYWTGTTRTAVPDAFCSGYLDVDGNEQTMEFTGAAGGSGRMEFISVVNTNSTTGYAVTINIPSGFMAGWRLSGFNIGQECYQYEGFPVPYLAAIPQGWYGDVTRLLGMYQDSLNYPPIPEEVSDLHHHDSKYLQPSTVSGTFNLADVTTITVVNGLITEII
jgi:hypothetical protein